MPELSAEDLNENRQFTSFEHAQKFFDTLDAFLSLDLNTDPASDEEFQRDDARSSTLRGIVRFMRRNTRALIDRILLAARHVPGTSTFAGSLPRTNGPTSG